MSTYCQGVAVELSFPTKSFMEARLPLCDLEKTNPFGKHQLGRGKAAGRGATVGESGLSGYPHCPQIETDNTTLI